MKDSLSDPNFPLDPNGLNEFERETLDSFCEAQRARTPQEQAILDQAVSELRDQLAGMGLTIDSERQFYTACIITVATTANMINLVSGGMHPDMAEQVSHQVIAGLRPDHTS